MEIVATLETPAPIRDLQRALYLRAKQDARFRAYALYDKVYRPDILAHAYALAKANGGAPGPDGVTFEEIEATGGTCCWRSSARQLTDEDVSTGTGATGVHPEAEWRANGRWAFPTFATASSRRR